MHTLDSLPYMVANDEHSKLVSVMPIKEGSGVLTPQQKKVRFLKEQGCIHAKGPKTDCVYLFNRFGELACINQYGDIDWSHPPREEAPSLEPTVCSE